MFIIKLTSYLDPTTDGRKLAPAEPAVARRLHGATQNARRCSWSSVSSFLHGEGWPRAPRATSSTRQLRLNHSSVVHASPCGSPPTLRTERRVSPRVTTTVAAQNAGGST